jgi:hypothetical protein
VAIIDPLRQQIAESLEGPLDGEAFERCATALLSQRFPNLVPVPGGDDAGFDGALVSIDKPRTPLVCTVSPYKAARKNLQNSLKKVRDSGSKAEVTFFATPRKLTNRQRRALEELADELGFHQLEIFEQEWFQEQLYRDDSRRLEFLGITGRPSVLSRVPLKTRTTIPGRFVGREEEQTQLRGLSEDIVLWGQPGVGKTALLEHLSKDG